MHTCKRPMLSVIRWPICVWWCFPAISVNAYFHPNAIFSLPDRKIRRHKSAVGWRRSHSDAYEHSHRNKLNPKYCSRKSEGVRLHVYTVLALLGLSPRLSTCVRCSSCEYHVSCHLWTVHVMLHVTGCMHVMPQHTIVACHATWHFAYIICV